MKNRRQRIEPDHSIHHGGVNLTPLIDVVFVVLIMFILVAPMLELDRIQLAAGPNSNQRDSTKNLQEQNSLVIHVYADNSILVNGTVVSEKQLSSLLQAIHLEKPHLIPKLFQDKRAQFGTYQTVKNAVELAGFSELDLFLDPGKL